MSEFDYYIRQGEPSQQERAEAWAVAIGLQDVDGLKTSQFLRDTAKRHIEESTQFLELFFRNVLLNEQNELKKRYEHIRWHGLSAHEHTDEPINEPISQVLEYIRSHEGCKRQQIADALGMTLISTRRALAQIADKIEYRGSNKTGGYYIKNVTHCVAN